MHMARTELPSKWMQHFNLLRLISQAKPPRPCRLYNAILACLHQVAPALLALLLVSCSRTDELSPLRAVLTSDHWFIELGSGLLQERYVYTFEPTGAYKACVFSQFGTRPMKGTWKMTQDAQGRIHLLLENEEAYYYFLWRDSILRYKKENDALVVSSPHYGGEKELRRTLNPRGQTNAPPPLKPHARKCGPPQPPHCRMDRLGFERQTTFLRFRER